MPSATLPRELPMTLHLQRVQRGVLPPPPRSCLGPVLARLFMIGFLVLAASLLVLRG